MAETDTQFHAIFVVKTFKIKQTKHSCDSNILSALCVSYVCRIRSASAQTIGPLFNSNMNQQHEDNVYGTIMRVCRWWRFLACYRWFRPRPPQTPPWTLCPTTPWCPPWFIFFPLCYHFSPLDILWLCNVSLMSDTTTQQWAFHTTNIASFLSPWQVGWTG